MLEAGKGTVDALVSTLQDTRLEPDLEHLLWGQVDRFQRRFADL